MKLPIVTASGVEILWDEETSQLKYTQGDGETIIEDVPPEGPTGPDGASPEGPTGPTGAMGATGPTGPTGPTGGTRGAVAFGERTLSLGQSTFFGGGLPSAPAGYTVLLTRTTPSGTSSTVEYVPQFISQITGWRANAVDENGGIVGDDESTLDYSIFRS